MTGKSYPRQHPALAFATWPRADQLAWEAAVAPADFGEDGGRGATWRAASKRAALGSYSRWLGWLSSLEVDLVATAPGERITRERMAAYTAYILDGRASVTAASYLAQFIMVAAAMFPNENWAWLRTLHGRLKRRAIPSRVKEIEDARHLFALGMELIETASPTLDRGHDSALDHRDLLEAGRNFRDGLILALLAARPVRMTNLWSIAIGKHLREKRGRFTLHFSKEENKTPETINAAWPEALVPALKRYLKQVRPLLSTAPTTGGNIRPPDHPGARLWVGQGGTILSPSGINLALNRHVKRAFGHHMTAHWFRDSAASTIANNNPDDVRLASKMLGHKRLTTTERHYVHGDNTAALAQHHELIKSIRAAPSRSRFR